MGFIMAGECFENDIDFWFLIKFLPWGAPNRHIWVNLTTLKILFLFQKWKKLKKIFVKIFLKNLSKSLNFFSCEISYKIDAFSYPRRYNNICSRFWTLICTFKKKTHIFPLISPKNETESKFLSFRGDFGG